MTTHISTVVSCNRVQDRLDRVRRYQYAIEATAKTLDEMITERDTKGSEWCKSNYLAGGLLAAIELLAQEAGRGLDEVGDQLDAARKPKAA